MAKPKIMAFYLPQYHAIPENDEWWGKGFTEWTNVKKAVPLYKNHNQPRIPLNDNYYDLLDPKTFEWQVNLANEYRIDGFCFYHYWFNGKLLLEKPLEMYLNRSELNLSYCFSWANEPWARTWDGLNKSVLMPQEYAGMEDIINHFNYMLPFFRDTRYIKIDNKPVFVLYRTNSITYIDEMIEVWNKKAVENGFDGIYFVETLSPFQKNKMKLNTNASVYFEPGFSSASMNIWYKVLQKLKKYAKCVFIRGLSDYRDVWKHIFKFEKINELKWACAFVDWDNTARKGKKGSAYSNVSPLLFEKYFSRLYSDCVKNKSPYVFINAWNEWGEGTYLEPDTKNEYAYLQAIKNVVYKNKDV